MGAQEVRTSRWPAGTWSWLSPPSSACTSRGQPRHNDCREHLWILFDIADGWNPIWYSLLSCGGKIISVTFCVGKCFFFLFFLSYFLIWWNFCHVNTMMFFIIIIIISSLLFFSFSDWLTSLWISAHPQPPHQSTAPPSPTPRTFQMSSFHASCPCEAMAQNWHLHPFLYTTKKEAIPQSLSVQRITIPMLYWTYYRLLNKGKTFRFLTIQFLIMECARKKKKQLKNNKKPTTK